MKLGVIADDFTGATDIAGFLVSEGLSTVQLNGVPENAMALENIDVVVISLKSRSCPVDEAIDQSCRALDWLKAAGCQQFFFKYCSTFDSTAQGNIGPVTDALMKRLGTTQTVICPALPVNGRDVFNGNLFVLGEPLNESGMRHHPVTPMTDSNLVRLMERQAEGRCSLINWQVIEQGAAEVEALLGQMREEGVSYVVLDAFREQHLTVLGEALLALPLITGGSGLGAGLARAMVSHGAGSVTNARRNGQPVAGRAVVLSGSCSQMTNRQVAHYCQRAPHLALSVERCLTGDEGYVEELLQWVLAQPESGMAPLVYATAEPLQLQHIQQTYGAEAASHAIEQTFGALARRLQDAGIRRFIVAGGETSGIVTQSLAVDGFHIGPQIAPGVPWVKSLDGVLSLALKSGNFGDETFFSKAQEMCHD